LGSMAIRGITCCNREVSLQWLSFSNKGGADETVCGT
jgi:hypothetical protein